jgi:hypothetical protein
MFQPASTRFAFVFLALAACDVEHHPIGERDAAARVDGGVSLIDGGGGSDDGGGGPIDAGASEDSGLTRIDGGAPTCSAESPCGPDGVCTGTSCDTAWECLPPIGGGCTDDVAPFCGCDGVTFGDSSSCPTRPYAHRGPCEDGVDCGVARVLCDSLPPRCEGTTVPSVSDGCWTGRCVEITNCRCTTLPEVPDCPAPYECDGSRCAARP